MNAGYPIQSAEDLPPIDELVLKHGELVKRIAYHVVSRLPRHIEVERHVWKDTAFQRDSTEAFDHDGTGWHGSDRRTAAAA